MNHKNIDKLTGSKKQFLRYVAVCNRKFRSLSPSIYLYQKIVENQKAANYNAGRIVADNDFLKLAYVTLISWNMNMRGARLVDFETFEQSICDLRKEISLSSKKSMHSLKESELEEALDLAEQLFAKLKVMGSKSRIVGVSKTMHFLLPRLFPPMDRRYTMSFFYGHQKYANEVAKEFETFRELFREFYGIARKLALSPKDVDGQGWNTTVPKLIDNAIIGCVSAS